MFKLTLLGRQARGPSFSEPKSKRQGLIHAQSRSPFYTRYPLPNPYSAQQYVAKPLDKMGWMIHFSATEPVNASHMATGSPTLPDPCREGHTTICGGGEPNLRKGAFNEDSHPHRYEKMATACHLAAFVGCQCQSWKTTGQMSMSSASMCYQVTNEGHSLESLISCLVGEVL